MKQRFFRIYAALTAVLAYIFTLSVPVMAAFNPATGDERGQRMGIVIGVLVVSVILIVALLVLSKKKKKK